MESRRAITTNHYPLRPLWCSILKNKASKVSTYRKRGLCVCVEGHDLVVFHTEGEKVPGATGAVRELVAQSMEVAGAINAYHRYVGHLLRRAGLIPVSGRREYVDSSRFVDLTADTHRFAGGYAPDVRGYYRWTWDIEIHSSGRFWLVPLLGLRYIFRPSILDPQLIRWLEHYWPRPEVHVIHLQSGKRRKVRMDSGQWVPADGGAPLPLDDGPWHMTLNTEDLRRVGLSDQAFDLTRRTVHAEPADLTDTPLAPILEQTQPLLLPYEGAGHIAGAHLRFGSGTGSEMRDVLRLGWLQPPEKPVRLVVCAPDWIWKQGTLQPYLRYQLTRNCQQRWELQAQLHLPPSDTFQTVWVEKWHLPPYDIAPEVMTYSKSGQVLDSQKLVETVQAARDIGRTPVGLLVLPYELLPAQALKALQQEFHGVMTVVQCSESIFKDAQTAITLFSRVANVAAEVAVRAGGVPWELHAVPGTTERTVFLGIDLGHNHQEGYSHLALTLFDHRGRALVRKPRVCKLPLNEQLPDCQVLVREFQSLFRWAGTDRNQVDQVIVHRDGRFLPGEEDRLLAALAWAPNVSLVAIKKDPQTHLAGAWDGLFWVLTHDRALLVTNTQDGGVAPLEVELRKPGRLSLAEAVAQVFWLSRVYQGSLFHAPKLPITTRMANNSAGTGNRVHLKWWATGPQRYPLVTQSPSADPGARKASP